MFSTLVQLRLSDEAYLKFGLKEQALTLFTSENLQTSNSHFFIVYLLLAVVYSNPALLQLITGLEEQCAMLESN